MLMLYTVKGAGSQPDSPFLKGCFIDEISTNNWQFKEGAKVIATATGSKPKFKLVGFHGFNWTVEALSTSAGPPATIGGRWSNDHNDIAESDSWTAEGTGKEKGHDKEDQDEARTAGAK